MVDIDALEHEVKKLYDRLEAGRSLNIPSSSISIDFRPIGDSGNRGVVLTTKEDSHHLDVYATGADEAIQVISSFLAGKQLERSASFGVRHAALMYILPILHLILSYFTIAVVGLTIGVQEGAIAGIGAILSLPALVFWVAVSLKRRREEYYQALEATGHFESSGEIEKTLRWLKVKDHHKWYWIKRAVFFEVYYLVPTAFLLYYSLS